MNNNSVSEKNNILTRIANHLIINASYTKDLGLYHGKMGIVIFFAHYSRYTGETLYDDFAGKLMGEIVEEIHSDIPLSFERGLCGIGWGVEYLFRNGFMEGDSDDILSEIDKVIMEKNLERMSDMSVSTGLEGIAYYIAKRLESSENKKTKPFDIAFSESYTNAFRKLKKTLPDETEIISTIYEKQPEGEDIIKWQYGMENGCAGYGLKIILG